MKKNFYFYSAYIVLLSVLSCSSVNVLNSWKGDNINSIKDKNVLVIARTNNTTARITFENEIVEELTKRGIKAAPSFNKSPEFNPDKKITQEDEKKIKSIIEANGYEGVILTVVKDTQELTKTVTDGGYYAGSTYYGYYPRYYHGFYGYYYHPMAYSTLGNYVPETSTTYTSKNYILETVIYNLEEPQDKQLIGVVTSKVEDPSDLSSASKQYVKAIAKSFDK
ncbi:hypothetical protein RBH94_08090 [Aestuariibaculum sp. YM273]|uniref:hypothetical protein n=1 Tax=Aestuariibaculum sp. YM273 TaxID=3070659 RepID=UPI0027DAFCF8|nr:hypothetical protein [Aestuariibaculum sp. YM273]WMI64029.1 hypothetical protein RBH94_08090 [Aestuariibaculum sp. YM273]